MIRITRSQPHGSASFCVQGRAVGAFGEELVRYIREVLAVEGRVVLDLSGLVSVDQPTLEFLVQQRERCELLRTPAYVERWVAALGRAP